MISHETSISCRKNWFRKCTAKSGENWSRRRITDWQKTWCIWSRKCRKWSDWIYRGHSSDFSDWTTGFRICRICQTNLRLSSYQTARNSFGVVEWRIAWMRKNLLGIVCENFLSFGHLCEHPLLNSWKVMGMTIENSREWITVSSADCFVNRFSVDSDLVTLYFAL